MDNMKREFKCDITSHPIFIDACTMRGRYFPCPFCGSEKTKFTTDKRRAYVYCTECYAHGPVAFSLSSAAEGWNNRVSYTVSEEEENVNNA